MSYVLPDLRCVSKHSSMFARVQEELEIGVAVGPTL